ncbi:MAG: hypothetical protein KDA87_25105 [Planctomycetales bacterium]|nr:hypothetical protein [Planctomycetales bacterium]
MESYAAFRADRFRTWKHVRGRRPHLKMFWDNELVSLLSRFHFDGVNIGSFRFLGAPNEGDFRDVGGERYLRFALWGRHLMYVKEGTSDIFFCDYQDWMFQAAEIQSKPLLSLLFYRLSSSTR